ncbi:hypothetical protein [Methylocystis parvus]|uniref:hypothetical protein n=1 Tax=Methylocystis parvus TaxID=134 RepID=UPI003C73610C
MFDLNSAAAILLDENADPDIAALTLMELQCWIYGPKKILLLEAGRALAAIALLSDLSEKRSTAKLQSERQASTQRMLRLIEYYRKGCGPKSLFGMSNACFGQEMAKAKEASRVASQVIWFSYVFSLGEYKSKGGGGSTMARSILRRCKKVDVEPTQTKLLWSQFKESAIFIYLINNEGYEQCFSSAKRAFC